jgi:hypothetical protein
MVRYVVLFLALAAPAYALPLEYEFTADSISSHNQHGRFTYDPDVGASTLTSFIVVGFDLGQQNEFWPANRDAYPYTSASAYLVVGAPNFSGSTLDVDYSWVLSMPSPYLLGCPEGTALPDCPRSSFEYEEQAYVHYTLSDIQPVPEPAGVGELVAAAMLLAAATRRLLKRAGRDYGQ